MVYYVYVKFVLNNVKKVTSSVLIKAFHPKSVVDFTAGHIYHVYWERDEKTKGGYYDAEILQMTALPEPAPSVAVTAASAASTSAASASAVDNPLAEAFRAPSYPPVATSRPPPSSIPAALAHGDVMQGAPCQWRSFGERNL
ncbi:hypothetical protein V5799_024881 [Amblyomma americanum]|uniref:Uncharacterized protein n=1 Tax=Amblyomma americanum TaxID=6943 RepID=A0AAQ4EAT6_AMBAM